MMKKILPILLCYVLMTSQVFAISGGPVFGSGTINPVGTYSGVVQGVSQGVSSTTTFTGNVNTDLIGGTVPSTALGLFSLSVPTTSVATGAFILFSNGSTFTGNIDASIDVDSNQLSGLVFGYQFEQRIDPNGGTVAVETAYASGRILGKVAGPNARAASSARITGNAFLNVTFLNSTADVVTGQRPSTPLIATVSGFRQSTAASAVSSLPTLTNNGG